METQAGSPTRGFASRRRNRQDRLPPGQYDVGDAFPVLSAGPSPRFDPTTWDFSIQGLVQTTRRWSWSEFLDLPHEDLVVDLHCVTAWSKFDTRWRGVPVETLLDGTNPSGGFVSAWCDGGYTTDVPLPDLLNGRAWIVDEYDGAPLAVEHGGPARLLVPHLYLWKSAKWVRGLAITATDEPGFWEGFGYHSYGDPWREQRYAGD